MRTALLLLLSLLPGFALACGGDGAPAATATPVRPTSTPTTVSQPTETPALVGTPTPTISAPSPTTAATTAAPAIGLDAVIDPFDVIQTMFSDCANMQDTECLARVVAEAELLSEAEAFWQQYQAFLVTFEDHGTVDFGAVSSPFYNMARPEPVFLNGGFGLLYVGEVVPEDWQSEPSYADLPDIIAWIEYAVLVEATTSGDAQVFAIEIPLQQCRACETLGYLNIEVSFEAGVLQGVEVLAKTDVAATPNP